MNILVPFLFFFFYLIIFQVATLFEDHQDLLDEFTRFLPDTSVAPVNQNAPFGRSSIQRYNERNSTTPTLRQMHMDKVSAIIASLFSFALFPSFLMGGLALLNWNVSFIYKDEFIGLTFM